MTIGQVDDRDHIGRALRTIEQCALHRRSLRLTCQRCRLVRVLDAIPVWWLFQQRGWPHDLSGAARRFACSACRETGHRSEPTIEVGRDRPEGPQPPYPDEREWKRLVSRYRS
ncbi:hypothetical protein [Sphingomonas bacterium]|uniref:hypothetical protein n=1 Tax=Sphingomonas bacterium TaxID=1895847 RepID=UPI001576D6BD|nr:hypothetical protein [Sphingomonas bacterium]